MQTPTLGSARSASTLCRTISEVIRIPARIEVGEEPGLQFEWAGPRAKLLSDAKQCAGDATYGGLCSGLKNVLPAMEQPERFV